MCPLAGVSVGRSALPLAGASEHVGPVEVELSDALLNVIQGPVGRLLLGRQLVVLWKPPSAELLDSTDVDDPVVEMVHKLGHVLVQELLVSVHRVTCEGTLSRLRVLPDEGKELVLRLLEADLAVFHGLSQTRLAVMLFAPIRHSVQELIWLIYNQIWSLCQYIEFRVGDDAGHLDDVVLLDVQSRHLQVHPDHPLRHGVRRLHHRRHVAAAQPHRRDVPSSASDHGDTSGRRRRRRPL